VYDDVGYVIATHGELAGTMDNNYWVKLVETTISLLTKRGFMYDRIELYKLAVPLAGLGIWERDMATHELSWNAIIPEILEASPADLPRIKDAIGFCENPELVKCKAKEVIVSQAPRTIVTQIKTLRDNKKWVRIRMHGQYEESRCTRLFGTVEDITDEISVNKLLEEREQLFTKAFENAPIGMALVGLIGNWIKVNASLCELLGYTEEEFFNHAFQDYTHPDDLRADLDLVEQLLNGEIRRYSMEKRYFHRNGSIVWAQLNVSLIRGEGDRPLYFISQIKGIPARSE
jgi:PAS domain S-box-containing protein